MGKIKILIADDHPIFRAGLKNILTSDNELEISDEAANSAQVLEFLSNKKYDVLILDVGLPGRSGIDVMTDIKKLYPGLPVLIMSMHPEERFGVRALKAGASSYLSKEQNNETLVQAVKTIAAGKKFITKTLAEKLAMEIDDTSNKQLHEKLSQREFEVMRLIASGRSIKEIGDILSLSINTVNTYRTRIFEKMDMKTNMELAHYAIEYKLID